MSKTPAPILPVIQATNAAGELVKEWPVEFEVMYQAAALEVELHNRDNPEDVWTLSVIDPPGEGAANG